MRFRRLQTRFILAGGLLAAATAACGVWSALTFIHLSAVVDRTVRDSQETVDLAATLAGTLEREDDALLLALTGEIEQAREDLKAQRDLFKRAYDALAPHMRDDAEKAAAVRLRVDAADYERQGDAFLTGVGKTDAIKRYHSDVNPALRRAVADCETIRELNFRAMRDAGVGARDEAQRATAVVAFISGGALILSVFVSALLARSVLRPIQELTASADALRQGDFDRRVRTAGAAELARLAEGFNRMAENLSEYRQSSLGELLAAKQTLEATLDALPDAVIVLDPAGAVAATNPRARAVLAAVRRETAARLDELPFTLEQRDAVRGAFQGRRSAPGQAEFTRALTVALNGTRRKFLLTAAPIPEFLPRRHGAVVVLDDVTEFAHLDELRTELIAVASHELKTPLTTLSMNLMLLGERADNLTPRQRELVGAAVGGCEELAATIDELLDLTRIEAGQLRLERVPVRLAALITQAIEGLRSRFDDAEIAVRFVADDPHAAVRGDAARLRIVLTNLLTNALKYTPRGGAVEVRLASRQNAGGEEKPAVQIAVTDSGPGVPAEYRERVFEKFFRVEHQQNDGAPRVKGAGVGLYLCKQIVEAHGGTIRCESGTDGRGARLVIELAAEA
jgi:NtrC-family two-component system sensor histidine kinase KinB